MIMRILCAPDSFKGSLTAAEVADAMSRGIRRADSSIEIDVCPVGDGGEGTVEAIVRATGRKFHDTRVTGPTGDPVLARWGILGDANTAVIEASSAAGLGLVPEEQRDPTKTTTFGVGELIAAAISEGCSRVIVGIGGSATCDGGCGMAQALGAQFTDRIGNRLERPITGGDLTAIGSIDMSDLPARLENTRLAVACDVTNPLYGAEGAARIYGPQKGATPEQVQELDAGLKHLASHLTTEVDPNAPGMGAAGGLGFGLAAFAGAELKRGIDLVLDIVHFDVRLAEADLVITGEGRLDEQTFSFGKAVAGVATQARNHRKPVAIIAGSCTGGRFPEGLDIRTLSDSAGSEEEAIRRPGFWVEQVAHGIAGAL